MERRREKYKKFQEAVDREARRVEKRKKFQESVDREWGVGGAGAFIQKLSMSEWFVTVNTNKAPRTEMDSIVLVEKLKAAVTELGTVPGLAKVLQFMDPGSGVAIEPDPYAIKNAAINFVTEVGKRYHRVHVHFKLTIVHSGKIHISKRGLEEFLLEQIDDPEITSLYTHWIFNRGKSYTFNLEQYLRKDQL